MKVVPNASLAKRLFHRVKFAESGCWEWTGYVCKQTGYGKISNRPGPPIGAHVAAWLVSNGPVPDGFLLRHSCDNRLCCSPYHLDVGTQVDNMADMHERGRFVDWHRDVTSCPQEHPYDSTDSEGYRSCSICRGVQARRQARRQRIMKGKEPKGESCPRCAYLASRCRCVQLGLVA